MSIIKYILSIGLTVLIGAGLSIAENSLQAAQPKTAHPQAFAPMSHSVAKTKALEWTKKNVTDKKLVQEIEALWKVKVDANQTSEGAEIQSLIIETFRIGSPETAAFLKQCDLVNRPKMPPVLEDDADLFKKQSDFFKNSLQLYNAHYLTRVRYFDEALFIFEELKPQSVADPATYFFSRVVCENSLLLKKEGLATSKALLEKTEHVPLRYRQIATLMQHEMKQMKDGSLDQISRLMSNVERKLGHGRVGAKIQKDQEEILAALDLIIEKMEPPPPGGGGGGPPGSGPPSGAQGDSPAENPYAKKGAADGKVDKDNLAKNAGAWGNLDAKKKARVKAILEKDFPSHYKRLLEEYSRASALNKKK